MNRLIIVGNGFDLAHGLKTGYADFLWYLLQKEVRKIMGSKGMRKESLLKVTDVNYLSNIYERFNSIAQMESVIERLSLFYNHAMFKGGGSRIKIDSDILEQALLSVKTNGWTDIEFIYYSILDNLRFEYVNKRKSRDWLKVVTKKVNLDLELIKETLHEFIYSTNSDINDEKVETLGSISEILTGHFYPISIDAKRKFGETFSTINFLFFANFNYTSTHLLYNKKLSEIGSRSINIHGNIVERDPREIIFGWGDDVHPDYIEFENINEDEFLINSKSILYHNFIDYRVLMNFVYDSAFEVQIIGHSCGLSDRTLLSQIFNHENCIQITPNYYIREDKSDDFQSRVTGISRCFNNKNEFNKKIVNKKFCKIIND